MLVPHQHFKLPIVFSCLFIINYHYTIDFSLHQVACFTFCVYVLVTQLWVAWATPWTVARQAPLSMEFSRQEYWSGQPFPSPGALPDPGIEPRSPATQVDSLSSEPLGKLSALYLLARCNSYYPQFFLNGTMNYPHSTVLLQSYSISIT